LSFWGKPREVARVTVEFLGKLVLVMSGSAFIGFRVTPEVKTLLQAVADREQLPVSVVARQLIETMLRSQAQARVPSIETMDQQSRDARLSIRLDPEDRMMLLTLRAS
jgi:hypothetical protein